MSPRFKSFRKTWYGMGRVVDMSPRSHKDLQKDFERAQGGKVREDTSILSSRKTSSMSRKERYALHVQNWKDCTRCYLHECRSRVILCRGQLPCDVLWVGEAPGESEDTLGIPFVGPAGYLLDRIIHKSIPDGIRYALTNVVACIPRDGDGGKLSEPSDESVKACAPRLVEFVGIASPKLIVCVGSVAWDWLDPDYKKRIPINGVPLVKILHPAYIIRSNIAMRGLMEQKAVVTVRNAVEEHLGV